MEISLDKKRFITSNTGENSTVGSGTMFSYNQFESVIWATFSGGGVKFGTITGYWLDDDELKFSYQHVDQKNNIVQGICTTKVIIKDNNKLQLIENWSIPGTDIKGVSISEEI